MATKTKAKPQANAAGRFAGMKLVFAGQPQKYVAELKDVQAWAEEEGATVQSKLAADTDLLVVLERGATAGPVKQAIGLDMVTAFIFTPVNISGHTRQPGYQVH